jgi:hypothetical protein
VKKLTVGIASLLILLVLSLVLAAAFIGGQDEIAPSQTALEEVPKDLIPLYQAAADTCEGMDWTLLAAVHKTETTFGRGSAVSSAGAQGPMQFMPPTWAAYGVDGNGDDVADTDNLEDAVFSAANYLCANGAGDPQRLRSAVWHYNHDLGYVDRVVALSASYGVRQPLPGAAYAEPSRANVLDNPRIILTDTARLDIEQGLIDGRVLAVLEAASQRFTIAVSVLKTGHTPYVAGTTSFSNHFFGRAADIYAVNGQNVSPLNPHAQALTVWLSQFPSELRPSEVGSPFASLLFPGAFSDADHLNHIHIGFD